MIDMKEILIDKLIKDKYVGAVASKPSHVTKCIINKIDFVEAKVILEYGLGNGAVTKHLLNRMNLDSTLFIFETNEKFIKNLSNLKDNRLIIINADAEKAQMILENRYKIKKVDCIISTIPLTFVDRKKRRRIIFKSFSLLKKEGKFITAQYSWFIYNLIKKQFSESSIKSTLFNMPPIFIIIGIK